MGSLCDTILVSIVVPIYNVQIYLEKCLNSICNQSYTNIEIILIDDGSEDDCLAICKKFAEKDKRIKVLHQNNGGVVKARKAGSEIARGQYIVCVDADDWIEKDRIHKLVNSILSTDKNPDMVYMSGYIKEFKGYSTKVEEDIVEGIYYDEQILERLSSEWIDTNKCFKNNICYSLWMWAIRKEIFQYVQALIDERISIGEDYFFIFISLLQAKTVRIIQEAGYHYQQRSDSITHSFSMEEGVRLKIWYQQLRRYLILENASDGVMKAFLFSTIRLLLMTDYSSLLKEKRDYLFPFTKVCKDSRIVIYGLGRMGCALLDVLKESEDYKIVGLVDQKIKKIQNTMLQISDILELQTIEYDYIVIAILDEDIAKNIKRNLIKVGILESKIALMDYRVITEDVIPQSFRKS